MKILMLGWEFPPHNSGGLGVACQGLAQALVSKNTEVTFVLPKKVEVSDETLKIVFADIPNMKIRNVDTALTPYATSESYARYRERFGDSIYGVNLFNEVLRYAEAIVAIAEEEEFDVIHAHDWLSFLAGVEAKRVSGKPLVLHVHASGFELAGGNSIDSRVYSIEKEAMEKADAVIAVSGLTRDVVINRYGIDGNKVHVVHNGIEAWRHESGGDLDRRLLAKWPGYQMVLYVGRMSMHKGPDYFLRAAKKVLEYNPKVIFVMAGSGDMEWQLIRMAAQMGIADKVFFAGFSRGDELNHLYREADLFILPSVSEPFGLTPLESLINGTPVLISKQSGVSEVLKNALKVDFWDTDEMANQIIAVLRDSALSNQLSNYGKGEAYSLTWHKAAQKCIDLYHDVTGMFARR